MSPLFSVNQHITHSDITASRYLVLENPLTCIHPTTKEPAYLLMPLVADTFEQLAPVHREQSNVETMFLSLKEESVTLGQHQNLVDLNGKMTPKMRKMITKKSSLFSVGQELQFKGTNGRKHVVLKNPDTYIYRDKPGYLTKVIFSNKAMNVAYSQSEIESDFELFVEPVLVRAVLRFPVGSAVLHKESGGFYVITLGPDKGRLVATNAPAYSYKGNDGVVWHRSQKEMEDGRFILHRALAASL